MHNLSKAGKPLLVRYDLAGQRALIKEALAARPANLWRYREFLPVRQNDDIVSLGEVMTPLIRAAEARQPRRGESWIKDEGRLPTGSFKARGLGMAVSMAKELGHQPRGDAHQRQRRRGAGGLRRRGPASKPSSSARTTRPRSTSARSPLQGAESGA